MDSMPRAQRPASVITTPHISTGSTKASSVCLQCVMWNDYEGSPEKVLAWQLINNFRSILAGDLAHKVIRNRMAIPAERDHIGLGFEGRAVFTQTAKAESDWMFEGSHVLTVISGVHLPVFWNDKVVQESRRILPLLDGHPMRVCHALIT